MDDNLVQALGTATWTVCAALTSTGQAGLQASVDRACAIRAGFNWERRAAAHAEFFTALSDGACDRYAALVLSYGAELAYSLMIGAGHAADVIVVNSRKRMLAHLRAGDAAEATREMENHLSALNFMGRLAVTDAAFRPPPQRDKFKFLYLERTVATPSRDRTPPGGGWPRWRDDRARSYRIPP
jgi:hypothetical protein